MAFATFRREKPVPHSLGGDQPGPRISVCLPEALLWHELRERAGGLRFSRRRATGRFVHDLYCPDARIAIEIDPGLDDVGSVSADDLARNEWLERAGIEVIHVPALQLLEHAGDASDEIVARARKRLPPAHPAAELSVA